uniref:Androgen induced 1 n=1 Tax=Callorhinchus milii TaxID=7868 RepID=A0A4W3HHI5_CALMI
MALIPSQVLRLAILLSYLSVLCTFKALDIPAHQTYGGSWKFLTFINLVIQTVFFGICVLTDLSSLLTHGSDDQEQQRQLRKLISLRDWLMAVLAFPTGTVVVIMFWALYMYDREMVYPKILDSFIPQWVNHGMHTTVLPFLIIQMRTTQHRYPSRQLGHVAVCLFSMAYIVWIFWIQHMTGLWVYTLLEHLSCLMKIGFFAAGVAVVNVLYVLGDILNSFIWDEQTRKLGSIPGRAKP